MYKRQHTGWVDAQDTSDEERDRLEALLHTELPESDDVEEIESSARYFTDSSGIHMHSLFLTQSEGRMDTTTAVSYTNLDVDKRQKKADCRGKSSNPPKR